MKNLATALFALFALLSATAGCATDAEPDEMPAPIDGRRDVITDDRPAIDESVKTETTADPSPRVDNGQVMWVEVIDIGDSRTERLHSLDTGTGIDTIEILDADGEVARVITTRYSPTEITVADRR